MDNIIQEKSEEKIIKSQHIREYSTVFVICQPIRRDQCAVYHILPGQMLLKKCLPPDKCTIISPVNGEIIAVELHLTHIHDIVTSLYQKIYLCSFCIIRPLRPRSLCSDHPAYAKSLLYLWNMQEAYILKGDTSP